MILSIDPGAQAGWSLFGDDNRLVSCGLNNLPAPFGLLPRTRLVAEMPSIHRGTRNPGSIITLAISLGRLLRPYEDAGMCAELVLPVSWKGNVPKDTHHARQWAKLVTYEQAIVDAACKGIAPSKRHNILDAVFLGLWAAGRAR